MVRGRTSRFVVVVVAFSLLAAIGLPVTGAHAAPVEEADPDPDPEVTETFDDLSAELTQIEQESWPSSEVDDDLAELEQLAEDANEQYLAHPDQLCDAVGGLQLFLDYLDEVLGLLQQTEQDLAGQPGTEDEQAEIRELIALLQQIRNLALALRFDLIAALPEGRSCGGPNNVHVDPTLQPVDPEVPVLPDGTPRPVATLVDEHGTQIDFVENELSLATADQAVLDHFLERWDGTIIRSVDSEGVPEATPIYQVRIDPSLADPSRLSADLDTLTDVTGGAVRVSSEGGLHLLAAAAEAAVDGLAVMPSWLDEPSSISTRQTTEGPDGPSGFTVAGPYSRNAYDWVHLNSAGVQRIGVTEAWTLLESIGRLHKDVAVAIIDEGVTDEAVRNHVELDNPEIYSLGITQSKRSTHGLEVAQAAAGMVDNGHGGAGTGAPAINRLLLIDSGRRADPVTRIAALNDAYKHDARIMNMSWGAPVPAALAWTLYPFEAVTALMDRNGALLIAAAGNAGADVDAQSCAWPFDWPCWEKAWHYPCENNGVLCIGGVATNSLRKNPSSNHGGEHVDLFAPFSVLVGPNVETGASVHVAHGTSVAAPYVAGVAALLKAANPDLTDDGIEDILLRTARVDSPDRRVRRLVQALAAVRDALPPLIRIRSPLPFGIHPAQQSLRYEANIHDDGLGVPEVEWTLDDGTLIGTGTAFDRADLPLGRQRITATARFPGGQVATDTVTLTFTNEPPGVRVESPRSADGSIPEFRTTQQIALRATSSDPDFGGGPLRDDQVTWHLDGADDSFASGHALLTPLPASAGEHAVTARACDGYVCAEDTVTIRLVDDAVNLPPQVRIAEPANGSRWWVTGNDAIGNFAEVPLRAEASDPDGDPVTLVWTDSFGGAPPVEVATGPAATVRLYQHPDSCESTPHELTLIGTDSAGNRTQDTVTVTVTLIC